MGHGIEKELIEEFKLKGKVSKNYRRTLIREIKNLTIKKTLKTWLNTTPNVNAQLLSREVDRLIDQANS